MKTQYDGTSGLREFIDYDTPKTVDPLEEILNQLDKEAKELEIREHQMNATGTVEVPTVEIPLPHSVNTFLDRTRKVFKSTVYNLIARAEELENAAEELRRRALELENCHIFEVVENDIKFENECHLRQQSLALVKPKVTE